jgi:hypothetical protein
MNGEALGFTLLSLCGWMDGRMDGWMDGWMGGWVYVYACALLMKLTMFNPSV